MHCGINRYFGQVFNGSTVIALALGLAAVLSTAATSWGASGDLDSGFAPNVTGGFVAATAMQPDGKIIISGSFNGVGGVTRNCIARLNTDGTLDTTLNATIANTVNPLIHSVALQSDGKILIAGEFTTVGAASRKGIARLKSDGTLDTTFAPGTGATDTSLNASIVTGVLVQPDGKVVIAGYFKEVNGQARDGIARLNTDGSLESTSTFAAPAGLSPRKLLLQPDGKLLVSGYIGTTINGTNYTTAVRLNTNGTLDTTFRVYDPTMVVGNPSASDVNMMLQPDGKVILFGNFSFYKGAQPYRSYLARLNTNGTIDLAFGAGQGPGSPVSGLALQTDGKMIICGSFTSFDTGSATVSRNGLARVLPDGSLDTAIFASGDPGANSTTFGLALQSDGQILLGGDFTSVNSQARGDAARFVNDAATQSLTVDSRSQITWMRGGSSPETNHVTFEQSTDAGATWTALGSATRITGGWRLASLSLPASGSIRARCDVFSGGAGSVEFSGATGLLEQVQAFVFAPNIAVEQPAGTNLVDGSATVNFGSLPADSSIKQTFTVKNTGNDTLTSVALTIDGTNAADFTVSAAPGATTIAPAGSTTFDIQCAPSGTGTRTATLHIASNDPDESPFDITLTAAATPPAGALAFSDTASSFTEDAGTVSIPLVRSGGSAGEVTVNVTTTNGTATAPSDYAALVNQTVTFADGVTTANVSVALVNSPATSEANETFTLALSSVAGGAHLGTPAQALVTIIDSSALTTTGDTAAPAAPVVASPATNAVVEVNPGSMMSVTGTATDNKGVKQVTLSLNNNFPMVAALGTPGAPKTTFNFTLLPLDGLNTIRVQSTDFAGRASALVTRTFTVARPLVVNLAGSGTVTAGFAPTSARVVGKAYTLTATPKTGFVFNGWTTNGVMATGITPAQQEVPTLTFTMQTGLTLTASFIDNPFIAVAGNFNGLVKPSASLPAPGGTVASNDSLGFFTAAVATTGAFTGKLTLDGTTQTVSGVFDNSGVGRFGTTRTTAVNVTNPGQTPFVVTLSLDLTSPGGTNKLTGTVTQDYRSEVTAVSTIDADHAAYNGSTVLVPDAYLTITGTTKGSGVFTAFVKPQAIGSQPSGFTTNDYPQGEGYAAITVTKAGGVTLSGVLADGTPVTASTSLSKINTCPLYVQLYSKQGFISGTLVLNSTSANSDMSVTGLQWSRPYQTGEYYPFGWPEIVATNLFGAKYAVTANVSVLKKTNGNALAAANANGNAALTSTDGKLASPIVKDLNLSTNVAAPDVVAKLPVTDASYTLAITRSSGKFTGTFLAPDGTKPVFQGLIYQKGTFAGGHGYFLTPAPKIIDYTGKSGHVSLTAQ